MTAKQLQEFLKRIDRLKAGQKPLFGKMNAGQMICHCTDFFRLATGKKRALEYGLADPRQIIEMARSGKSVPTPKGFDQIKGEGTKPSELELDKKLLKSYIIEFFTLPEDYPYAEHPYFGKISRERWQALAVYHLNHHLEQFGL